MARGKRSLRKIQGLLVLMLLTLILAITATYAWFSTQRDIEVSGMRLNVEVAESLQISLDGEIWTQSIKIANMRQFYGTYTGTGDGFAIYQAKKPDGGGNTNYVPTELLPVSSAGEVSNGKLQFVQGKIASNADGTTKLTGITACSESDLTLTETVANRQNGNASHPYLVFDMYLRNISAKTTEFDNLLLDTGSSVWINGLTTDDGEQEGKGVTGTGLEYSARVGMIVYANTLSVTATESGGKTVGERIRGITADGTETAAIWEPNNKEHTAYVVANNGRGITSTSEAIDTYGVKVGVASAETKEISNVNSTEDANLVAVNTFTPEYTTAEDGVDEKTIITDTNGANLQIAPNQISKVRVYVWLEGQDPDCIDLASTGDKLNVTLKLTKDETDEEAPNSYIGKGTTGPTQVGEILTANEASVSDYGAYVTNYTTPNGSNLGWRILYSDDSNIYLIADDYVERSYVPTGKNSTAITPSDTYANGFSLTTYADYAGATDITSKWLSGYKYSSTNTNMKATAYLLDTNQWAGFANNTHASYAIGAPTLELFMASYNAMHDAKIDIQVSDENGYKVKWASSTNYAYYITGLSTTEDLYVINDTTNAMGMWVASPSSYSANALMRISYHGRVAYNDYSSTDYGVRPIVVLNSNVRLQKQADGSYLIVE